MTGGTARYRISNQAVAEMEAIWLFVADDDPAAADGLLDSFRDAFVMLGNHPRAGRARSELGEDVRSYAVGSYVILYRILGKRLEIIHVIHGARDLPSLPL